MHRCMLGRQPKVSISRGQSGIYSHKIWAVTMFAVALVKDLRGRNNHSLAKRFSNGFSCEISINHITRCRNNIRDTRCFRAWILPHFSSNSPDGEVGLWGSFRWEERSWGNMRNPCAGRNVLYIDCIDINSPVVIWDLMIPLDDTIGRN